MNKKIMMVGISLMLVSVVIAGCTTQSDIKKQNPELKPPIFKIPGATLRFALSKDENFPFSFSLFIENPNNETIQLQLIYLNLMDGFGNILFSFDPRTADLYFESYGLVPEEFSLQAHENITFICSRLISNNSVSKYCWDYLSSLEGASISGLYKLNGELQWFNSRIPAQDIPI